MILKTVYGPPPDDVERIEADELELVSEIREETQALPKTFDANTSAKKP